MIDLKEAKEIAERMLARRSKAVVDDGMILAHFVAGLEAKSDTIARPQLPVATGQCTYCGGPRSQCDPFRCREH